MTVVLEPTTLAWLLLGVRLSALFTVAPVFGHPAVPVRVRVALALVVAWGLASVVRPEGVSLAPGALLLAVAGEVVLGVTLGFATQVVFAGLGLLGELVSVQGGLGAATVLDPASNASSVVLASLFQAFAILVFLALDGHHELLRAAAVSAERLPPGAALPGEGAFAAVGALGASMFEIAVRIAAPVTAAMLLSNLAVGVLGRTIPQLNLMTLQLPAHVGLTLLILGLGAHELGRAVARDMTHWTHHALGAVLGGS